MPCKALGCCCRVPKPVVSASILIPCLIAAVMLWWEGTMHPRYPISIEVTAREPPDATGAPPPGFTDAVSVSPPSAGGGEKRRWTLLAASISGAIADEWTEGVAVPFGGSELVVKIASAAPGLHFLDIMLPSMMLILGVLVATFVWLLMHQFERLQEAQMTAQSALSSRNKFISYLCHELRNPLNSATGMIDWLKETHLTPQQLSYVHSLETSSQLMCTFINDTLDLGKLEAGKVVLESVAMDLRQRLEMLVHMHRAAAEAKGIRLLFQALGRVPRRIYGDPTRFLQILTNLLSNGIKATSRGCVSLRLRCCEDPRSPYAFSGPEVTLFTSRPGPPPPPPSLGAAAASITHRAPQQQQQRRETVPSDAVLCWLECEVADTGIGIPESGLCQLFQPYSQPTPGVSREPGSGTGLGLSFVRSLVSCWGGEISVRSAEGVGTAFVAKLPVWVRPSDFGDELRPLAVPWDFACGTATAAAEELKQAGGAGGFSRNNSPVATASAVAGAGMRRLRVAELAVGEPMAPGSCGGLVRRQLGGGPLMTPPSSPRPINPAWPTVLVVDDDPINVKIVRHRLERHTLNVLCANNGREAVEVALHSRARHGVPVSLILMDLHMPEMTGHEAAVYLRERGSTIPIVALTGSVTEEEKAQCEAEGMAGFLAKPISEQALLEAVKSFLPAFSQLPR